MYKAMRNKPIGGRTSRSGVRYIKEPDQKWGVYYVKDNHQMKVCDVMNYMKNTQGVAEGIAKVLNNQNKYKLPVI